MQKMLLKKVLAESNKACDTKAVNINITRKTSLKEFIDQVGPKANNICVIIDSTKPVPVQKTILDFVRTVAIVDPRTPADQAISAVQGKAAEINGIFNNGFNGNLDDAFENLITFRMMPASSSRKIDHIPFTGKNLLIRLLTRVKATNIWYKTEQKAIDSYNRKYYQIEKEELKKIILEMKNILSSDELKQLSEKYFINPKEIDSLFMHLKIIKGAKINQLLLHEWEDNLKHNVKITRTRIFFFYETIKLLYESFKKQNTQPQMKEIYSKIISDIEKTNKSIKENINVNEKELEFLYNLFGLIN